MPKISVVIPVYNKGFIVRKTLESVINQTFSDFEIIIVNDGSTDDSVAIIESFNDERIHLFHQGNKGAAAARNLGIEKSNTTFIAFLDADDIWFPNHLEELYQLSSEFPNCGLYASRYYMKIADHKVVKTFYKNIADDFRGVVGNFFEASLPYRIGLTSSLMIPKFIVTEKKFNPKVSSGQDLELYTKIAIEYPVALTSKFTVEYNFSLDNQLSKTHVFQKTLMDFNQFASFEKTNEDLKKFLDMYRVEYAIQYKLAGDQKQCDLYIQNTDSKNISWPSKLILWLPIGLSNTLLQIKRWLRKKGIDFSIYN